MRRIMAIRDDGIILFILEVHAGGSGTRDLIADLARRMASKMDVKRVLVDDDQVSVVVPTDEFEREAIRNGGDIFASNLWTPYLNSHY